jgi:CHASE1-domain containing sensor protein
MATWTAWWIRDLVGSLMILPVGILFFGDNRHGAGRRLLSVTAPVVVSALIVCGIFGYARDWQTNQARIEFDRQANSVGESLQHNLQSQLALLHTLASFYSNADDVTRQEFTDFVRTLLKNNEWVPRVTLAERANY